MAGGGGGGGGGSGHEERSAQPPPYVRCVQCVYAYEDVPVPLCVRAGRLQVCSQGVTCLPTLTPAALCSFDVDDDDGDAELDEFMSELAAWSKSPSNVRSRCGRVGWWCPCTALHCTAVGACLAVCTPMCRPCPHSRHVMFPWLTCDGFVWPRRCLPSLAIAIANAMQLPIELASQPQEAGCCCGSGGGICHSGGRRREGSVRVAGARAWRPCFSAQRSAHAAKEGARSATRVWALAGRMAGMPLYVHVHVQALP